MSDLLNPANLIVLAVIVVGMFFGLRRIVASTHGKSCCSDGASGKKAKKVVVTDTDPSHCPYSDELLIGGMSIYKDIELKAYLEQAGFHGVQIHKKKSWLCVTARK